MKKIKYIYCLLFMILINFDYVDAITLNLNPSTATISYIVCGLFIFTGIVIIIISKMSNSGNEKKAYFNKDDNKNEISGLVDKEKILSVNKNFNPDSIYKTLPNFLKKKFLDDIFEELKKKIMEDTKIKDINLIDNSITDFKDDVDNYTITTEFIIEKVISNKEKIKEKYIISSISDKNNDHYEECPNCGGKIKDCTKLRCKYCNYILPKINTSTNEWKIEKIEKN